MLRFWRLRKFIRDTTSPIPYETAKKWDTRLGRTYNILAFTTFCLTVYTYFQWKRARREATGVNETDAEYYTRILNIENARVMRFSLSGKKLMDEYISPDQIREKYNLPPPTNPTYRPPVKTLAPTPTTEQLSS